MFMDEKFTKIYLRYQTLPEEPLEVSGKLGPFIRYNSL